MSATGALLLLAAAATFLAVNWDALGLTARVAVVGAGTAAAIVGGARLRRTLPAVGAVVFHLGALLLPVDALGLALQLDIGRAGTWTAVGATALVTLPVAAHVGRSRLLAAAGLAGVPILATGLGLAGIAPAPLLTAVVAVLALAIVRFDAGDAGDPRLLLGLAAPSLAITAVAGPLLVAMGSVAVAGSGGGLPLRAAAAGGWIPTTWTDPALAGAVAVAALTGVAALRRSSWWAGAVPILIALVAVTMLLPGDAPRLARLLPWPLLFLAVESAAVAARRDRALGGVLATTAVVSELLAALAVPGALLTVASANRSLTVLLGFGDATATSDPVLAAVAGVTALAWLVAVARRRTPDPAAFAAAGAGIATLAATLTLVAPASGIAVLICLAGLLAATTVRGGGATGTVVSGAAVLLAATAVAGTASVTPLNALSPWIGAVLLALVASVVTVAVTLRLARHAEVGEGAPAAVFLLPTAALMVLVVGGTIGDTFGLRPAITVASVLLVACAALLDRLPVAADTLRGLAVATVLLAGSAGPFGLDEAVTVAPAALVVAVLLGVESARCRRGWLLAAAGTVLVRGVAGVAYAVTGSPSATGATLLVLAIAAALTGVVRADVRAAAAVTAVAAGVPAFALLSLTATAFAWATVGVGAAVVAGGLATRQVPVAHVGGVVVTFGVWQLLALHEVTTVDAWLLTPALQVWFVGLPARRAGRVSSWVADVPPLALVLVPALLERLAGGSGWHAALAGSLALVAVVGGGVGRHGGPLVVGVVGVVAVVLIETLAVVAAVPTWAWLTAGGVVLLGTGALIERTGGTPVATVRRLADVVAERFD